MEIYESIIRQEWHMLPAFTIEIVLDDETRASFFLEILFRLYSTDNKMCVNRFLLASHAT